jgi:ATP-binding cassette subfamily B protein
MCRFMIHKKVPKIMNYNLKNKDKVKDASSLKDAYISLKPLLVEEKSSLVYALVAIIVNSAVNLVGPLIIAYTIDTYFISKNFHGVVLFSVILAVIYIFGFVAAYLQTMIMGGVGRRVLFKLRNTIFTKLQELPVAFFNANKAGDLISRINSDTDKLNQFFSQALVQFVGNLFLMLGAGIFLVSLNPRLGLTSLIPALLVLIITQLISPWIKKSNFKSLQSLGAMSAEIQESIANFKVVVVFNRLDYFRVKFDQANQANYKASIKAGVASNILMPIYTIASNVGQIIVLAYGISLVDSGSLTIGLLVGFLLYVNNFYTPLRQLAQLWSSLQLALASMDRIGEVLSLSSTIVVEKEREKVDNQGILSFNDVSFAYPDGKEILHHVNLTLEKGKTYALVGPTGGGKTTTASLMARLFDPTSGTIYLDGINIKSYEPGVRTQKIGFILQDPFLFTGTVAENIIYGNKEYEGQTIEQSLKLLKEAGLDTLLVRFDNGLETKVGGADSVSLGQKQLIAFMRAILRKPDILILDEATANVDTVTEAQLEEIMQKLPKETTKVIIAHRLNTIENADDIFFVNGGEVLHAGSFDQALDLLLHGKRVS